jgi:hypothetical protein
MENSNLIDEMIQILYDRGMKKDSIAITITMLETEERMNEMILFLNKHPYSNPGEIIGQVAIICNET